MGNKLGQDTSRHRATSRILVLVLLIGLVVGVITTEKRDVEAATVGNTDVYEDGFNGFTQSRVSSAWWGGASVPVSQRYGCTSLNLEDGPAGAAHGCPKDHKYWHHGIDIGVSGTLTSQFSGTVVESASGVLGIQTGNGVIVDLIHGTPLVSPGPVNVGDNVYTVGSLAPCGGSSTGVHLHFEVHKSRYPWCSNLNDDINPEEWLLTQCTVTAAANSLLGLQGVIGSSFYLNWYDNASPGFTHDTVHILNPITSSGQSVTASLAGDGSNSTYLTPGQEWYTFFSQHLGGPVSISGNGLLASRRTQYYNSFNETNAVAVASTDQFLPWFDKASGGFCADNIHVTNPSSSLANVTITRAGQFPLSNRIPAGQGAYFSWAPGLQGGPIEIVSDQPVIASERISYMHSLSENNAIPAANISQHVWFNWYDNAGREVLGDDVFVINPTGYDCSVNVSAPGLGSLPLSVPHGQGQYTHFGPSSLGGPVKVDVVNLAQCPGILAFQRTIWNGSFSQVDGMPISVAATLLMFNWYDNASTGMAADNIHLSNPSGGAASVSVTVPGATTQYAYMPSGSWAVVAFPLGTLGGPVTISSTQPVLASERVQFYSSFHEVNALGLR